MTAPSGPVALRPVEAARLERQAQHVLQRAEDAGVPITYLGLTAKLSEPRLYPGPETDWVVLALEDDPLHHTGRFPIPSEQRQQLVDLTRGGVEMDELLVAHELPSEIVRRELPETADGAPTEVDRDVLPVLIEQPGAAESTRKFTERAGGIAEQGAKVLKVAGAGVAAIAAAPVALTSAISLDPVIFGVRRVPARPGVIQVFELVRWDW